MLNIEKGGRKDMSKKPLIEVSLYVMVLLVLGSLSTVVGYQSDQSIVNDSPLFSIRTKRAMNQQQNIITSQYLGREKSYNLLLLSRPNETSIVYKIINVIQNMNDASFERFVKLVVDRFLKQEKFEEISVKLFIKELYQIRNDAQAFMKNKIIQSDSWTWFSSPTLCWFPGCFLLGIVGGIAIFSFLLIYVILFGPFPTTQTNPCLHLML